MYKNYLIHIFKFLSYIIFIELFFLIILGFLYLSNLTFGLDIRHKIHFSKNDLPHPLFIDYNFVQDYVVFDPNSLWYLDKYRWGKKREINIKKNNETFIYVLGGSTVEGDGSPLEKDSFVYKLEKNLSENGCSNIKVFNEGISGFSIKQEFISISTKILRFQSPDLIILFNGVNDFLSYTGNRNKDKYLFDVDWNTKAMYFAQNQNKSFSSSIFIIIQKTITGRAAMTFFDLFTKQPLKLKLAQINFNENIDNNISFERFKHYANLSKIITEQNNVDFLHIIQPTLFYKKNLHAEETFYMSNNFNYNAPEVSFTDIFWENFENFYSLIQRTNNVINASRLFEDSNDQDFIDHVHYTPLANTKIADYLTNIILDNFKNLCYEK